MSCGDLLALIDAVDKITAGIAAIAADATDAAANELVHARRSLASQALAMSRAIDEQLISGLTRLGTPCAVELHKAYQERRNRARTAIADHQAKWPAVEMRNAIKCYRADVGRLHIDQQAYRAWLRDEFIPKAAALLKA
jgi:hypothetical protein